MSGWKSRASRLLSRTPLQYWPVRVRRGLAKGAKWTFLPHSANWRIGGEPEIEVAIRLHGSIEGGCCWDLGAHFGIHSIGLAKLVGPAGQVAAFEPDPAAFRRLKLHVSMNGLRNVRLFECGVSDRDGEGEMIVSGDLGSTFTHFQYEDEPNDVDQSRIAVATSRLDTLVSGGIIGAADFIKIDIQGHGAQALRGASDSIEKKRPTILFSSHSPWESEGVRTLLRPLGYRCFNPQGQKIEWIDNHTATAILVAR